MKVKVKCSYVLEIELPEGYAEDEAMLRFRIEENGCPGTGEVGAAFDKHLDETPDNICWACNIQGANEILEIEGSFA